MRPIFCHPFKSKEHVFPPIIIRRDRKMVGLCWKDFVSLLFPRLDSFSRLFRSHCGQISDETTEEEIETDGGAERKNLGNPPITKGGGALFKKKKGATLSPPFLAFLRPI